MLKFGEKIINQIYLGDKNIAKAYLGDKLVFQAGEPIFLEYAQSDGNQYIDTGILCSYDYTIKIKYAYTALKSSYNGIFGTRQEAQSTGNQIYWVGCNKNGKALMMRMGKATSTLTLELNKTYELTITPDDTIINDTSIGDAVYDGEIGFSKSIRLFNINDISPSLFASSARVYYFQIYDKDMNLIQDLRPSLDTKGTVCMYDMVTRKYFYNAGTGEFVAGKFRYLEYIKSTGTQYIDTGINGTEVTRFVVKGTCLPNGKNNSQFLGGTQSSALSFFGARYMSATQKTNWYCMDSAGASLGDPSHVSIIDTTIASKTSQYGTLTDLINGSVTEFIAFTSSEWSFPNENLLLFGGNSARRSPDTTCYMLQLYTKDGLVRDFVPVLDTEGVACMYDKVTGKCFYNAGTDNFKGGRFVESLETTGTQYIDTGIKTSACRVEIVAECTTLPDSSSGYQQLFSKNYDYAGCAVFACNPNWGVRAVIQTNTPSDKKSTIIADFSLENALPKVVMTVDGVSVEYTRTSLPSSANHNWSLMSAPNRSFGLKGRTYSCKMYDLENNLLIDLRPYIDENKTACMKDLVSGALFYNQGTGTFGYTEE